MDLQMMRSSRKPCRLRQRRRIRRLGVLGALLSLAGCAAVGADYERPRLDIPSRWAAPVDAARLDTGALREWWLRFGDPVLSQLLADALAANLDLEAAGAALREARARRELAGAERGPSLAANANARRSRTGGASRPVLGRSTQSSYSASLDASWDADIFGELRRGAEAAEADLQASGQSLLDTRVSLLAEVALTYVDLRTTERRIEIAESSLAAQNETYELATWRLRAGLVSDLDVVQARTSLESTRAALPTLRNALESARNRLAVLLATAPGALSERLAAPRAVPLASQTVAIGIPADTLRQRPDVRAAERRVAAAAARLGQAQATRYPSLSLSGSFGLESLTPSGLADPGSLAWSLLASLTAPIFDSGRISANIDIQDAQLAQALVAYRKAVLTALEDVENALVAVHETGARRSELSRAAGSARETRQIAEFRYQGGLVDFLAVLDSQRTLLELEDQLATSTGDLASAQIRLYEALGGGWTPPPGPPETEEPS